MPPFLLQLIRDLHTGTTARVRTSQGMSDVFYTTSGVRQGCILAPALFCCAIDWLMRHCSGCFGVDVGNFHLTDINYADDTVLFTDDPTKWDYVFRNFEASAGVMGLHTNWHKTKIHRFGHCDKMLGICVFLPLLHTRISFKVKDVPMRLTCGIWDP